MPIASGAHGWSLEYRLKRVQGRQRPSRESADPVSRNYAATLHNRDGIPRSQSPPPKRKVGPSPGRRAQVYPAPHRGLDFSHKSRLLPEDTATPESSPEGSYADIDELLSSRPKLVYPVSKYKDYRASTNSQLSLSTPRNGNVTDRSDRSSYNFSRPGPSRASQRADSEGPVFALSTFCPVNPHIPSRVPQSSRTNVAEPSKTGSYLDDTSTRNVHGQSAHSSKFQENFYDHSRIKNNAVDKAKQASLPRWSSDQNPPVTPHTPRMVPVIIPRYPPKELESSKSPSPASSQYDSQQQESELESSSHTVKTLRVNLTETQNKRDNEKDVARENAEGDTNRLEGDERRDGSVDKRQDEGQGRMNRADRSENTPTVREKPGPDEKVHLVDVVMRYQELQRAQAAVEQSNVKKTDTFVLGSGLRDDDNDETPSKGGWVSGQKSNAMDSRNNAKINSKGVMLVKESPADASVDNSDDVTLLKAQPSDSAESVKESPSDEVRAGSPHRPTVSNCSQGTCCSSTMFL